MNIVKRYLIQKRESKICPCFIRIERNNLADCLYNTINNNTDEINECGDNCRQLMVFTREYEIIMSRDE